MRISDWSSDVCSSDLCDRPRSRCQDRRCDRQRPLPPRLARHRNAGGLLCGCRSWPAARHERARASDRIRHRGLHEQRSPVQFRHADEAVPRRLGGAQRPNRSRAPRPPHDGPHGGPRGHGRLPLHPPTGTLAVFSAVAALGRLLGTSEHELRTAFGIAASMSSGLQCNFGTLTKPFHAGWAAHNAVTAVALAGAGMTASTAALEAKSGFFSTYGTERSDVDRATEGLGTPFAILDPGLALKK